MCIRDRLNALKGETMAVIALCQFDLTRCFGYPYTKDNGASLGLSLIHIEMCIRDRGHCRDSDLYLKAGIIHRHVSNKTPR